MSDCSSYLKSDNRLDRNSTLSHTFSALKWFLALTVVADHFFRPYHTFNIGPIVYDPSSYPYFNTLFNLFVSFAKNYAVPIFFFISGYLLVTDSNFSFSGYLPLLKRRFKRLAIPFVFWKTLALILVSTITFITFIRNGGDIGFEKFPYCSTDRFHLKTFVFDMLGLYPFPGINIPLWYIRDLILALSLIPLLHIILKAVNWRFFIIISAIIFLTFFNDDRSWRFEVALLFFYSGYLMRREKIDIINLFRKIFPYSLILYPVVGFIHFLYIGSHPAIAILAKNINICLALPLLVYAFYLLVDKGLIKGSEFFASASFFIYVTHYPLKLLTNEITFRIFSPQPASLQALAVYLISYMILIGTLTAIFYILNRWFNTPLRLATGLR